MRTVILISTCFLITYSVTAQTITVDDDGPADFSNIQSAIDASQHGDTIEVFPGDYASISFGGKAVRVTSTDPDEPSIVNATIIGSVSDYSVIFEFSEGNGSVLTGFTVTEKPIYCNGSSPIITKNIIRDCAGTISGGAIKCDNNATPEISYNVITGNSIIGGSNNSGGAISNCNGFIHHNIITGNLISTGSSGTPAHAYGYGGGLYQCNGVIESNVIAGNRIYGKMYNVSSSNCHMFGAGLYHCNGTVKNNIITNNFIKNYGENVGGGIYGACQNSYNCVWANVPDNFAGGAVGGGGSISVDPLFVNAGSWDDHNGFPANFEWLAGEYHLLSEEGRWDPNIQQWTQDIVTSACIDTGDPSDDIGIEPNPNGNKINIGAFGGTQEASKSTSGISEPVCINPPSLDTNNDCKIDLIDFSEFAAQWMTCGFDIQRVCWE